MFLFLKIQMNNGFDVTNKSQKNSVQTYRLNFLCTGSFLSQPVMYATFEEQLSTSRVCSSAS